MKITQSKMAKCLKICLVVFSAFVLTACQRGMLSPKGYVAHDEKVLFGDTLALMLIVVLPVIILSFAFAFRYREKHAKQQQPHHYHPNWSHNTMLEFFWWGIPMVIIIILGVITWRKTHDLDPYRPLPVAGKPIPIQAIALRWKWLFLYPDQGIATVNYLRLPVNRPVRFFITSDAPMSALFIPRLGSQIYAMAGMTSQLNLYPSSLGTVLGQNSQFNGPGFSEMKFRVDITTQSDFDGWAASLKNKPVGNYLNKSRYIILEKPTTAAPVQLYGGFEPDLFQLVIAKYAKGDKTLLTGHN